ncbi:succinate--CoA ligase [ADP/GDP-forming] subunit alpha, mitochondrial-like [Eurosta solidaginis]|uniref:succinate--CoA ligase [ADP/GDP-forming] subunit alpha, mitochondrial-like n=1 Tax=Eurosta solidaginis TaxID=178769 RepID=UPI0035309BFE
MVPGTYPLQQQQHYLLSDFHSYIASPPGCDSAQNMPKSEEIYKNKVLYKQHALEYGTKLVGCVSLKKGGTTHLGFPVFASVAGAKKATDRHATVIYVVPPGAASAILVALEAEISLIFCITKGVP